jgi:cytochrome c553
MELEQMKKLIVTAAVIAGMTVFGTASAGDIAAGKAKAAVCVACHGPEGISNNPEWPNLRGQKEKYIIKQLKAFKAGTRTNPLMSPQAKMLSDQDIENVAAYWSSLPFSTK